MPQVIKQLAIAPCFEQSTHLARARLFQPLTRASRHRFKYIGFDSGQFHGAFGQFRFNTRDFKHHRAGLYRCHPTLRTPFSFSHAGFRRFFGIRNIRKYPNPNFAAALDMPCHGHTSGFDLAGRQVAPTDCLNTVIPESELVPAFGTAAVTTPLLLPVLVDVGVGEDAEQPRLEVGALGELVEGRERLAVGLLDQILGGVALKICVALERGVADGEFRRSAVNELPQLFVAPVMMSIVWGIVFAERSLDTDRLIETHVDMILAYIRA